jgi:hypothetical protein
MMWRARGQNTGPARDDVPQHVEEAAMGVRADRLAKKHWGSIRANTRAR